MRNLPDNICNNVEISLKGNSTSPPVQYIILHYDISFRPRRREVANKTKVLNDLDVRQ